LIEFLGGEIMSYFDILKKKIEEKKETLERES